MSMLTLLAFEIFSTVDYASSRVKADDVPWGDSEM